MDEANAWFQEDAWDAGFEGGRYAVHSRLWPFPRVFLRPPEFRKHPWHDVHELAIRDWHIPLAPLDLGQLCVVEAELSIRYQPTLRYAREHLEFLADLNSQLEASLLALLKDVAEQEIKRMENDSAWLEDGCATIEKNTAALVNEVLLMRGVHCRSRCRVEPRFAAVDSIDLEALPPWPRHQAVYEDFLRRRRAAKERIIKEQTEEEAAARRLLMEREAARLELARQEEAQRQARRAQEAESLQTELAAAEARLKERLDSEARQEEARLRLEAGLRQQRAAAEADALASELAAQRAELATEAAQQQEWQSHELRRREEQLIHADWLRQMQLEADIKAKQTERESEQLAEEARLAKLRESEARQREAQLRHEAHLRQLQAAADLQAKQMELDRLRAEMAKVEIQLEQQRDYEARQHREQLRHNAELRQWQTEQELKEKEIRAPGIAELEAFLDREIGMLAMERQRLRLEEEIRATKLARTRDFISRARRRKPEEADLSASGEEAQD